jgi:hypothetical protein
MTQLPNLIRVAHRRVEAELDRVTTQVDANAASAGTGTTPPLPTSHTAATDGSGDMTDLAAA